MEQTMTQRRKDLDTTKLHELSLKIAELAASRKFSHKQLEKFTTKFLTAYLSVETIINQKLADVRSDVNQRCTKREKPAKEKDSD